MISSKPRVLVIGGNPGSFSAQEKSEWASYVHGVESWVFATEGDYCCFTDFKLQQLHEYDVVIYNSNGCFYPKVAKKMQIFAENRPLSCKWVTMIEGDMLSYLKSYSHFPEILNASNLVNCINHHAHFLFASMTTTQVENLGIPVPVDGIRKFSTPRELRKREALICPWLLSRSNDYYALKKCDIPLHGYQRALTRKLKNIKNNWKEYNTFFDKNRSLNMAEELYDDKCLTIHREQWFPDYYAHVGSLYFWMNLDDRFTWGRFVLDAAALGVPIITTESTGHGTELFPMTTVKNAFSIDLASELANRLLDDEKFYCAVVEQSQEGLMKYTPPIMEEKLYSLLGLL